MRTILPTRGDVSQTAFDDAVEAWRQSLADGQVITETSGYNLDTSRFSGRIPAAIRPASVEQVQRVVKIARRFKVPIYPVSTGNNWGYGTSVPPRSPCGLVDLALMNRVLDFDEELGVVTLEPGVTQGQLSAYLKARGLPFLVPVTGAGPSCSVVANALERGFGITPVTDHFGAVISMKVVLPDGEIFQSYTRSFNAAGLAQAFKWGTGPYLDGLFSQSNLGIVVDASIVLQARAECSGALFFVLDSHRHVEEATPRIRELLASAGQTIGSINLMSRGRVECMLAGSRKIARETGSPSAGQGSPMPAGAWFGLGSVYGCPEHYRATCRLVRRCLRGLARRIRIYQAGDIRRLRRLSTLAAAFGWPHLAGLVDRLEVAVAIVNGTPSTFALPLAYAVSGRAQDRNDLNPARDGCGLFWYSPVVPLRRGVVGRFLEFAERTCSKHGLPAPMTLTALSPLCYASTIPLLFDRTDPDAERRATLCFEELYEEGSALGFVPYRLGAQFMPALARREAGCSSVVQAVKRALDPDAVLAPGRYSFGEGDGHDPEIDGP